MAFVEAEMRRFVTYLIGIAVFIYLIARIDVGATFRIILAANPLLVLAAAILIGPMILLEAFRWHFILRGLGIRQPFGSSFSMFASSLYIGFVTPARVGEFVRVFLLKGSSLGRAFFSVFADRISDVAFLVGVGYLGMFYFTADLRSQIIGVSVAMAASVLLLAVALVRKSWVKAVLRLVFSHIVPARLKSDVRSAFYDFHSSFLSFINIRSIAVVAGVTAASWIVYYTQVYLLAKALAIEISFFHLATIMSVAGLLSVLPISISGIGTRDAALVFFFGLLGIRSEFAIALSTLVLMLMVLVAACCFPFWLRHPVRVFENENAGDPSDKQR